MLIWTRRQLFKLLLNVGEYDVKLHEGSLVDDLAHAWRWWLVTGDGSTSRREAAKGLTNMPGWDHDEAEKASLQPRVLNECSSMSPISKFQPVSTC